jgi:hypothetical protein
VSIFAGQKVKTHEFIIFCPEGMYRDKSAVVQRDHFLVCA